MLTILFFIFSFITAITLLSLREELESLSEESLEISAHIQELQPSYELVDPNLQSTISFISEELTRKSKQNNELITKNNNISSLIEEKKLENESLENSIEGELIERKEAAKTAASIYDQILVDNRVTDESLIDFIVALFHAVDNDNFEAFKNLWHIGEEDSLTPADGVKYHYDNITSPLRKIEYSPNQWDDNNTIVLYAHYGDNTSIMIVCKSIDKQWKVIICD